MGFNFVYTGFPALCKIHTHPPRPEHAVMVSGIYAPFVAHRLGLRVSMTSHVVFGVNLKHKSSATMTAGFGKCLEYQLLSA